MIGPDDRPVAIVGAGPVGLSLAVDLAQRGRRVVLLDRRKGTSHGSRAICWAKRTLEIFARLGIADRVLGRGVTWQVGRVFHGPRELYSFDLQPEAGHRMPAFVNLQQYEVERYLMDRVRALPSIEVRQGTDVLDHEDRGDHVVLDTSGGPVEAGYLVACDGAASPIRRRMGLTLGGQSFDDRFLIADVSMPRSPFPDGRTERWFWFRPPFHPGQSALLHRQPGDIYRIDLQLGPDADPEAEAREEAVVPRIRAMVGDLPFALEWVSVYRFRCARLARFVHGRVIFCGDSAHVVSPFGARGGNGGVQDADNLGWKLAAVLDGTSPPALLDSYDAERGQAADENIRHSARATRFMTPPPGAEAALRDAVLDLAATQPFARGLVNSGRLSTPCALSQAGLQTPGAAPVPPGSALVDAPLAGPEGDVWLSDSLPPGFVLIGVDADLPRLPGLPVLRIGRRGDLGDPQRLAAARYGTGRAYLLRPDGHVAAVVDPADPAAVAAAWDRARGHAA